MTLSKKLLATLMATAVLLCNILPLNGYATSNNWTSFRGASNNIATTNTNTPKNSKESAQKFTLKLRESDDWSTNVSDPLIVDGYIYIIVGNSLLKVDKNGKTLSATELSRSIDFTCRMVYADNKLIIPLSGGVLEAIDASTMQKAWYTTPIPDFTPNPSDSATTLAHQSVSTLTTDGEYVYFATACADWTTSYYGTVNCVKIADGTSKWQHANSDAGYYWGGLVISGNAVIIGDDKGEIASFNKTTGAKINDIDVGSPIRSTMVLAENNLFVTSTDGKLHKIAINASGQLGETSSVIFAASSTGTPAVINDKAYVGGGKADYSGVIAVINTETMTIERTINTPASVQSAPLINTKSGYVYFTANATPGGIYAINNSSDNLISIFAPATADQNYCMASVIADDDGTLYYTNDSGKLFAVSLAVSKISINGKPKNFLKPKQKVQLNALISPSTALDQKIVWNSSSKAVSVSSKGVVTAKKAGKAVISAKSSNGIKASVTIIVKSPISKVKFGKKKYSVKKGRRINLLKKIKSTTPSKAYATSVKYKWSVSDKKAATISKKGVLKGKIKGKTVTVTIKSGKTKLGSVKVRING